MNAEMGDHESKEKAQDEDSGANVVDDLEDFWSRRLFKGWVEVH